MAGLIKATLSKAIPSGGGLIGDAMNLGIGISDYKNARQEGNSKAVSLAKAVGSFAIGEMMGVAGLGVVGVQLGAQWMAAAGQHNARVASQTYSQAGALGSGSFNMSEAGYTMRQRSINAISNSRMAVNSVLGNEARTYYHGAGY